MSSKFLCPDCLTVYDGELLNHDFSSGYDIPCPRSDCEGNAFEIDELMIPTIQTLISKGYTTDFCCSGHYEKFLSYGYICFSEYIENLKVQMIFMIYVMKQKNYTNGHYLCRCMNIKI